MLSAMLRASLLVVVLGIICYRGDAHRPYICRNPASAPWTCNCELRRDCCSTGNYEDAKSTVDLTGGGDGVSGTWRPIIGGKYRWRLKKGGLRGRGRTRTAIRNVRRAKENWMEACKTNCANYLYNYLAIPNTFADGSSIPTFDNQFLASDQLARNLVCAGVVEAENSTLTNYVCNIYLFSGRKCDNADFGSTQYIGSVTDCEKQTLDTGYNAYFENTWFAAVTAMQTPSIIT